MNMKLKTILARAMMTLLVAMLSFSGAWAQRDPIAVTSETTTFEDGNVYEVTADVSVSSRISVNGTVTLVLGEGTTLTATNGIEVLKGNMLTI